MIDEKPLKFSICMPAYNGSEVIGETIKSILSQGFRNYEFIIVDDNSTDDTAEVIKGFKDPRIKYFKNKKNLGYPKNLEVCRNKAKNEILFLMGQDDILLKDALLKTYNMFLSGKEIGVVTRPYYWFYNNYMIPVRAVTPYNKSKNSIISILDGEREVKKIFESVGQLSGLAYRVKYLDINFHEDIFPAHIYPFANIIKRYKVAFLKDYTIAVRITSSQTRYISNIYNNSPTESWIKMFNNIYINKKFNNVKKIGIKQVTTNYVGLIQIKNYGKFKNLIREILIFIKTRPLNIINPSFWFFCFLTVLIPRKVLIWLTDYYKNKINAKILKGIKPNL